MCGIVDLYPSHSGIVRPSRKIVRSSCATIAGRSSGAHLKYPTPPMLAAANKAGYPPAVLGAPRAMAHAAVGPATAANVVPELTEWKIP